MTSNSLNPNENARNQSSDFKKPLTALAVKNHRVGFISDVAPYSGLRVRANKNGTKTWIYRYRAGLKLKQIKLGTWPGMELSEARRALLKLRASKEQNIDPQDAFKKAYLESQKQSLSDSVDNYTFGLMVEHYLSERVEKDRKVKGAKETRRLLERDLGALKATKVNDVSGPILHHHILTIASRAPDVARVFRSELARAWRYAVNIGRTDRACLINTDMGGKLTQGRRERSLGLGEVQVLLEWISNYSTTVGDALKLVLFLGLRSGEVCKLRSDWVREENDGFWIVIPSSEMKRNHSDHWVPLSGEALQIVLNRVGGEFLFPSKVGNHIKQKVLGVEIYAHSGRSKSKVYSGKKICPVKDWAPNDLRKTARSHLAALGCPFEVAESILHHKINGVAGLYNQHRYLQEKREWLSKLEKRFCKKD